MRLADSMVVRLSAGFAAANGDAIGEVREARFLAGGTRVLVLDRYSPHLRLFTTEGKLLWTGGRSGGGPAELRGPQAIAVKGAEAIVLQRGRIGYWTLRSDSLEVRSEALPAWYYPLGGEYGCDDELLLYGMDGRDCFSKASNQGTRSQEIAWLHVAHRSSSGALELRPMWTQGRDPSGTGRSGHRGLLISRTDSGLVLWHRSSPRAAGQILELNCNLVVLRSHSEAQLATGDSIHVLEPRKRALEWTNGIVALRDGFVIALARYTSARTRELGLSSRADGWSTELFRFQHGRFVQSVSIPAQWFLMDYDPKQGLLMSADEPQPHFVVVPPEAFTIEAAR